MITTILLTSLLLSGGDATPAPAKIADGIYVIIHPDASEDWPNGNTTVVIGERGVLVVDSAFLPSVARQDIAAIKTLTGKPVRYLVNTHWHYDHNNGNSEYAKAYPDVQIVAHVETRRLMDANGPRFAALIGVPANPSAQALAKARQQLASGLSERGAPLTSAERAALERNIAQRENQERELAAFEYAPPTLTFTSELRIDLGRRDVRVMNFGRGNTPGDAVVFLPQERTLVAGDLVVAPVPYAYNSYPRDWIGVLGQLRALDPAIIVPGHGPVQHDTAYVQQVQDLLRSVVDQVDRLTAAGHTLDEIRKAVDVTKFRTAMAGGDAAANDLFDDSIVRALIERAYTSSRGGV